MPEKEPTSDPLAQCREESEEALKIVDPGNATAMEVLYKHEAAIPFFELGLKLGRANPEEAEALIAEIRENLKTRKQQIRKQLYP